MSSKFDVGRLQEKLYDIISDYVNLTEDAKIRLRQRVEGDDVVWSLFISNGLDSFLMMNFPEGSDDTDIELKTQAYLSDRERLAAWLERKEKEDKNLFEELFVSKNEARGVTSEVEPDTSNQNPEAKVDDFYADLQESFAATQADARDAEIRQVMLDALICLMQNEREIAIKLLAAKVIDLSTTYDDLLDPRLKNLFRPVVTIDESALKKEV